MKKNLFLFAIIFSFSPLFSQNSIKDSISLGSPITQSLPRPLVTDSISLGSPAGGFSYPNDVYYNMQNGAKTTVVGHNWHLAFAIRKAAPPSSFLQSATILANEGRGVTIYQSNLSWSNFDTAGYTSWTTPHNSDTSWDVGAFNASRNLVNPLDFGWGTYDMTTHNIEGSKVFLVRITVGSGPSTVNTFKKVIVKELLQDSIWSFSYANINNSDSVAKTITKSNYSNRLFAYHNLVNDTTYNREPATKWDVVFTRYGAFYTQFSQTVFSSNTGVLSHPSLSVSKAVGLPVLQAAPGIYSKSIIGIGTDWKENPGPGQPNFLVKDSITYFTKDAANLEHKLAFSAFRGSSTGVIVFRKANNLPNIITLETYPNDVYYNMETGNVATVKGSNWHLAFAIRNARPPFDVMRSATVLANEGRGVTVYQSPSAISNWANFDTSNFRNWSNPHNSDSIWDIGALNANRDSTAAFDFGWGEYSQTSHDLVGTKMFLIRVNYGTGQNMITTFKKVKIEQLTYDTQWVFTYANINGSNSKTITLNKSQFAGKLFVYHNVLNDSTYDREPSTPWDLLFTRYGAFYTQFGQTVFSTNTGALSYPSLLTSRVGGVLVDSAKAGVYSNNLTGIGTDWKANPGPGQPNFIVYDSLTYFTKRNSTNREDKLVFESFRGASSGSIVFVKTNITLGTSVAKIEASNFVAMYPNPASNRITVEQKNAKPATVSVVDLTGRVLFSTFINEIQNTIDISALQQGLYFVFVENDGARKVARLLVQ